jgi:sugar/nucleoside kinase (ribokinase family)
MLKAICVGRICYDINLVVDKLPVEGSITEFFEKQGCGGGAAANIGYALAKWGIGVAISGVIGNDANGARIKKEFEKLHIDTRYIEPTYDNDTPISINIINKSSGEHTTYNISDKYIGVKKCDFDFSPDLVVVDGYDVSQAKNVLDRFPNALTVLDATIMTKSVVELVRKVKYAVLTQEFAEMITGIKVDFQDPSTLVNLYQKLKKKYLNVEFIVTLGSKGALYSINQQIKVSPSLKVDVVDKNGSGNIFRAAVAYTLANGGDVEKAVKMGCIAAGLSLRTFGARTSIPTMEEITNTYEQNY